MPREMEKTEGVDGESRRVEELERENNVRTRAVELNSHQAQRG